METPVIDIIGAGAMGNVLGGLLHLSGARVRFWQRAGLRTSETQVYISDKLVSVPPVSEEVQKGDFGFIAVKAYDLKSALKQHRDTIQGCNFAVLSNGWFWPNNYPNNLLWGMSTVGAAFDKGNRTAKMTSATGTICWSKTKAISPVMDRLFESVSAVTIGPVVDGLYLRQKKWLFNTVINTVTAVFRLPSNGCVLESSSLIKTMFDEAYRLGESKIGSWQESREELFAELLNLVSATTKNQNSMYRDMVKGRKTESSYLAGIVLKDPRHRSTYPYLYWFASKLEARDSSLAQKSVGFSM
ncbi:MAG: ketopantoate reductase family protein [Pseudobacteriovorax sp.]|nr:ketopantoate reductase family protein [Pseudobacteriovorax sp.]